MPFWRTLSLTKLILVLIVLSAALIPAGCAPKLPPEPAWEKNAREILDQAENFLAGKQYEQSAKTVESYFVQYPASKQRDRALYLMGEIRLTLRDYARGLSYYKEIIERYPSSTFILQARYKLGICYFELKEYDLAIANLEDRSKISDPAQLRRTAEMLATAYLFKKHHPAAVKELSALSEMTQDEKQKAGYRDRVREIVNTNLTEEELRSLSMQSAYPSDIARLKLAGMLIEQRNFRDAITISRDFLDKFPGHPEKTRAEMQLSEATARLVAPRYHIGALLPQSGQLAFFGDRVLKGIQLAVHTYNLIDPENRVEVLIRDTGGSPDKALAALTELASQGIVAAIGPLLTKEAEALAPALEKLKVPVITPAASGDGIGRLSPWLFRNALTNSTQAAAAAQYALGLNLKKFVLFYPDDAYGRDLARLFTRGLERNAEILASIAYPPDVKDFGPYARKVMEIDLRSRKVIIPEDDAERKKLLNDFTPSFDALYLPGHAEKVGLIIPQLAFYNIKGIALIGSNNWHTPDLLERADRHADGAVFPDGFFPESPDPAIKQVIDAYRSAYQEAPDILAAQAYDATMMVLMFLKDRKDTPLAIRDKLLSLKDYPGISGSTTFPGVGEAQKKLFLIKVQDGNFVSATAEKQP